MKYKIRILGIIAVIILAAVLGVRSHEKKEAAIILESLGPETSDDDGTGVDEAAGVVADSVDAAAAIEIAVHVCGCVNNPGVYTLCTGARINDAVAARLMYSTVTTGSFI